MSSRNVTPRTARRLDEPRRASRPRRRDRRPPAPSRDALAQVAPQRRPRRAPPPRSRATASRGRALLPAEHVAQDPRIPLASPPAMLGLLVTARARGPRGASRTARTSPAFTSQTCVMPVTAISSQPLAVDDERVRRAERGEHAADDRHPARLVDAQHLVPRAGRVRERPEQVEDRAHAELAADARDRLERRVEPRREQEADADLLDAALDHVLRRVHVDAERREHVRASPQREDTARLPCFATVTPAPATTNAAVVEMLNVCRPSPPVPQVSTNTSRLDADAVDPRAHHLAPRRRSRRRSRPSSAAPRGTRPPAPASRRRPRSRSITADISARERSLPSRSLATACWIIALSRRRAGAASCRGAASPRAVRIDSGWNWTPSTSSLRWRSPMISPSVGPGGDLERTRAASRARPRASGSAPPRTARAGPRRRPRPRAGPGSPCRARCGRCARPCPRTPGRSPGGRGTRRGSGSSPASAWIASSVTPASSGVHGPGREHERVGAGARGCRRRRWRRSGTPRPPRRARPGTGRG